MRFKMRFKKSVYKFLDEQVKNKIIKRWWIYDESKKYYLIEF